MSSEQISCLSDVLATQAPLADPHLLGWQIRKNGANIGSVLPLFQKGRRSMDVDRRAVTAGLAGFTFSTALSGLARAQQLEKPSVRLGVANKAHLYYLPLTLAERRGHFKDYGLNIAITDFEGGAQSLDALLAGTADVVTGAYEHTLRMQAQGQDIRALIELGRFPGIVLAVRKDRPYNSPADLKGLRIGVTAPDSSTHFFVCISWQKRDSVRRMQLLSGSEPGRRPSRR
jgi:hypothetical protein